MTEPIAPALRRLEQRAAKARLRAEQAEADKMANARDIDEARSAGHAWAEISEALGGEGAQYAYNLRKRLPDPS